MSCFTEPKLISRRAFVIGSAGLITAGFAGGAIAGTGLSGCATNQKDEMSFGNAVWIWPYAEFKCNDYAEFCDEFVLAGSEKVVLNIACDSMYAVYINDTLAAFAQCADMPNYKFVDCIDITKWCSTSDETTKIRIQVWHLGLDDTSVYCGDTAGLIYEAKQGSKCIAYSKVDTLSRTMNEYHEEFKQKITEEIGYSFWYDNSIGANPYNNNNHICSDKATIFHERKISQLQLQDRRDIEPAQLIEVNGKTGWRINMQQETAGFLELDFINNSLTAQTLLITYGEHLADGHVRQIIDPRNFSVKFSAKPGKNNYLNPFRRLAGKYVEIFPDNGADSINLSGDSWCGIREVIYPLELKHIDVKDPFFDKVMDACILTLHSCMHEHYEDCPWREQSLYSLDARNQMLCGYQLFEGHDYQRHSILFTAQNVGEDGLVSNTAPHGKDVVLPIPTFSLAYIMQVYEYVKYTKDTGILDEVKYALDAIMQRFTDELDASGSVHGERGILAGFDAPCWNFYEWDTAHTMDFMYEVGADNHELHYDLILNCWFIYAGQLYYELFPSEKQNVDFDALRDKIKEKFYLQDLGVYATSSKYGRSYSQLGNSMALLAGLDNNEGNLDEKIMNDEDPNLVQATLSMYAFLFDALLTCGPTERQEKRKAWVRKKIEKDYKHMMEDSTFTGTFWETLVGQTDFDNAASLCHGWSAIPSYYILKYFND